MKILVCNYNMGVKKSHNTVNMTWPHEMKIEAKKYPRTISILTWDIKAVFLALDLSRPTTMVIFVFEFMLENQSEAQYPKLFLWVACECQQMLQKTITRHWYNLIYVFKKLGP